MINKKEKISDILYLLGIIILLTILFYLFGNNIRVVFSDIGREMYISSEVANGAVLYKDIFNIFLPMGYFVNALIIKLFNNSINTFVCISYVLCLLILSSVYKIMTLYVNKSTSFFSTLVVLVTCTFASTVFNWHMPYSYSFFYSLASVMWALYFLLKYLSSDNINKYLYYTVILYSFSVSCKYDFLLFIFVILLVLKYKHTSFKDSLKSLCTIIIFPLISLIVLLLQKCTLDDILFAVNYIAKYIKSMPYFYQYAGLAPGDMLIYKLTHFRFESIYSLLGYINIAILLIYLFKKSSFKYIVLSIACILLAFKSVLYIDVFDWYGPFFFHFLFMNFVVFLSANIKRTYLVNIFLVFVISLNFYFCFVVKRDNYEPIHTDKGTFEIFSPDYKVTSDLLNFINNETSPTDKILVLPEGVLINYLTNRPTNGYLFHLISPNYRALGEDYIINLFLNQRFEYVVFHNYYYHEYNDSIFTTSWGRNFFKTVSDKYDLQKEYINENGITFSVYKLKELS